MQERKLKKIVSRDQTKVIFSRLVIVGGGIAGLALTYHLLNQSAPDTLTIEIMDPKGVGEGGASSAMAGLLHPLTPRGKKIWM
eukprot:53042-Rhodomonas_salina.1